ncbi:MAG: hypothetical protein M1827_002762 [Pycnora praestabilis]|nr:MAG: hypothetical protein M1827_002762 [Pycnora praestabilis]
MSKAAKRGGKPKTVSPQSPQAPQASKPPVPFTAPPDSLRGFVGSLDRSNVYITHVDSFPWKFKRKVFSVPVLLNVSITLALIYRLYTILPQYTLILLSTLGVESSATIDIPSTSWASLTTIAMRRALMFAIDWALYTFIYSWPINFFWGAAGSEASPVAWRWEVGFRDREVVVRVSRKKWVSRLLDQQEGKKGAKELMAEENQALIMEKIGPAVERQYLREKTGYVMMDESWDLDFQGMITATELITHDEASFDDFETSVLAYMEEFGWLVWRVYPTEKDKNAEMGGVGEEASRNKIMAFKDALTALGHESLFYRWIELIQYESTQPGGFTPERQVDAMRQAKEMFEEKGVDFEGFWKEVGGMEGLPGFDGG